MGLFNLLNYATPSLVRTKRQEESPLKTISRTIDAIVGSDEYEEAPTHKRLLGIFGIHDSELEKNRKHREKNGVQYGDIIGVSRGTYDHYGVYISESEVISYTSEKSDIGDNIIQATTLSRFLRGSNNYFILNFPKRYNMPEKIPTTTLLDTKIIEDKSQFLSILKGFKYNLYSPEETVERAKSRLGEDKYSLILNNCEHFAIWCKTGIEESHQVNKILLPDILTHSTQSKYSV